MKAAVAGTFNVIHDGHKALISRAFEIGDSVFIGITSDEMACKERTDIIPLYLRMKALKKYLDTFGKPYKIDVINDIFGPKDEMDKIDALVVSEETLCNATILNDDRKKRNIVPLEISVVPLVNSSLGEKISASNILKGEYGRNGRTNVLDIAIGTLNHVKIEAARIVLEKIYGDVRITAVDVDSMVPSQPFEEQTRQGAINRAKNALGKHEMAVGIEAGVFEKIDGLYDYQYCAIVDNSGKLTVGTGMGFRYPDKIADLVRSGYTVGDAVHEVYGNVDIGKKQGAIGLLSKGLIDRESLTEQSVTAAMIPRIWDE